MLPLLVAEQLAFDQLARDCRHVDRHERAAEPALAIIMQCARATSSLPVPLSPTIITVRSVAHQAGDDPVNLLHRLTSGRSAAAALRVRRRQAPRRPRLQRRGTASARLDHRNQFGAGRTVWEGTRRRRVAVALTAVSNVFCALITMMRSSGRHLLDARDQVQPVFIGHDDIGDHQVAFAVGDPAPQRRGAAGGIRTSIARAAPSAWFSTVRIDAVVVSYQNRRNHHQGTPRPAGRPGSVMRPILQYDRQEHPEHGASGAGYRTFDQSPPWSPIELWRPVQDQGQCRCRLRW